MQLILEKLKLIDKMNKTYLFLGLIKEFEISQLNDLCEKVENQISTDLYENRENIQKELVLNEKFMDYLAKFETDGDVLDKLDCLLKLTIENNKRITDYDYEFVRNVFESQIDNAKTFYDYINYFNIPGKSKLEQIIIANNLKYFNNCQEKYEASELTEAEKSLFVHPFLSLHSLIPMKDIRKVYNYLIEDDNIKNIIQMFYENKMYYILSLEDYETINKSSKNIYEILNYLLDVMGRDNFNLMIEQWIHNGCNEYDLRILKSKIGNLSVEETKEIFYSRPTYINFLYGNKISNINLKDIDEKKERLLVYALVHNKKSFLRLVEKNSQEFESMDYDSLLFKKCFYTKYFNINSLTLKDLQELDDMDEDGFNEKVLEEQVYTFEEIKTLFDVPIEYLKLYNKLSDLKIDERLLIIKQLLKKELLDFNIKEDDIDKLAEKLKIKTLYKWLEDDFKHIKDLNARNATRLLANYEELERFIPQISEENELLYLLRNKDKVQEYSSLSKIKEDIENIDEYWKELILKMDLKDDFINENSETIKRFLLKNGAELALTYYKSCSDIKKDAYKLIVKSELMGKFDKLKYHDTDLQKEIDATLTEKQVENWIRNNAIKEGAYEVSEYDDFYSTMILGEIPKTTCLSYKHGVYNRCLLACFDSNKKILYAKINGKPVSRAMVRLTKGKYGNVKNESLKFVDLEQENTNESTDNSINNKEHLTLFLERIYSSGITESEEKHVKEMFIKLLEKKATELNALLVLSRGYSNATGADYVSSRYSMLITKSKAGAQYLDSLNGSASVYDEGKYVENNFLIWNKT